MPFQRRRTRSAQPAAVGAIAAAVQLLSHDCNDIVASKWQSLATQRRTICPPRMMMRQRSCGRCRVGVGASNPLPNATRKRRGAFSRLPRRLREGWGGNEVAISSISCWRLEEGVFVFLIFVKPTSSWKMMRNSHATKQYRKHSVK